MESVSLRDFFNYHQYQLLAFILFLLEIPFFMASGIICGAFYVRVNGFGDIALEIAFAIVNFILHFILYMIYGIINELKIHIPMTAAQLVLPAICIPFMVYEFLYPRYWVFGITLGSFFLYQVIIFGAFAAAISLFDRYTHLREWKKTLLSFISAISVGTALSWGLWMSMEKLLFYMKSH